MKYSIIIFILLTSCTSRLNQGRSKENSDNLHQIVKIDSIGNYYVIYSTKNNNKYKIVSKKENLIYEDYSQIQEKHFYDLKLINLISYSESDNPLTGFQSTSILHCYSFDVDVVICEEEGMDTLYKAENLIGLYYLSSSQ